MGILFGREHNKSIPPNATFRITQQGTDKLQEFTGDSKTQILMALETGGTSDIAEISQRCGMGKGKVERFIPALIRGGYVQYVSANSVGMVD